MPNSSILVFRPNYFPATVCRSDFCWPTSRYTRNTKGKSGKLTGRGGSAGASATSRPRENMSVVSMANWVPFPKRNPVGGCHQVTQSLRKPVGSANLPSFPMMTFVEDYIFFRTRLSQKTQNDREEKKTMYSCKCIQTIYEK